MAVATSVAVSVETRDELRQLAATNQLSMDEQIRRLLRLDRQRRMGEALREISDDERLLATRMNAALLDASR